MLLPCIGLCYQELMSATLCSCGWLSEYNLNIMNELLYASQAQTENTTSPYIYPTYEFYLTGEFYLTDEFQQAFSCISTESNKCLGLEGLGMRLRSGNEVQKVWERGLEGLGMRLRRSGNEVQVWERGLEGLGTRFRKSGSEVQQPRSQALPECEFVSRGEPGIFST